jgi:hypothetical protein
MKTTKTFLLLITLGLLALSRLQAQYPGFEWAGQMGGDTSIMGTSIATDLNGNQIITGYFQGMADFDPGSGVFSLTSSGNNDIFILKLNADGNLLWAASMGDTGDDYGQKVVSDAAGNIYMTGSFIYSMDADPGPGIFYLTQSKTTAFVLKIQPDGNLVWAKQMGFTGDQGLAWGHSITLDNNQNVLTTGYFQGRVDLDPGAGTFNLTASNLDAFIQKLDNDGNFIWAKQITGAGNEWGFYIATDASGNVYTSGRFTGTADFDPNPNKKAKYMMSANGTDIFFQKLSADGSFIWAKQIGGSEDKNIYDMMVNGNGLFATGYFYGIVDFNPGSGTYNLTSEGLMDMYILKLDLVGNFGWVKQIGGPSWNCGNSITSDASGNIYTGGFTYATADFDPDPDDTYYITANGRDDSFICKSDQNGNFIWVTQTGGEDWDYGMALALDDQGNIFSVGGFGETVDFDPGGNGNYVLTNTGSQDMFIQKLNPSGGDDCPIPNGLAATDITETTSNLGWNPVSGATGYYVRYREILASDWIVLETMVSGTSLALSSLTSETAYEFQVRTDCFSNYSYSCEFMTLGGGCPDNYEPNETMGEAAAIPVNTDITALIGSYGDYDWFTFCTTGAAKNVTITLTNLPADYNIKLYKSNGTLIGSSSNTGTTDEIIVYNSNKTGTYYILVFGFQGAFDPVNCYTLQAATSSLNNKSADATGEISEKAVPINVYPNPAKDLLNIEITSVTSTKVHMDLISATGQTIISEVYDLQKGSNHYVLNLRSISNGLYVIHLIINDQAEFRKVLISK